MSEPLVSIRNLCFSYGRSAALTDVSLDISSGITVGLIGPNGGGKTTLLQLLLGQLTPDSGTVTVAGRSPRQAVRAGGIIGYLPQHLGTSTNDVARLPITIRESVHLGLAGKTGLFHPYPKSDLAFADDLIRRVGLASQANTPLASLSGGQLQRAYIARALAPRPQLLLLDEPTTGIDPGSQQRLIELLAELRKELQLTVILVSHDLRAVTSICDRIACLNTTLHYHDIPQSFPEHLAQNLFCCDLEAMGLGHGEGCDHGGGIGTKALRHQGTEGEYGGEYGGNSGEESGGRTTYTPVASLRPTLRPPRSKPSFPPPTEP